MQNVIREQPEEIVSLLLMEEWNLEADKPF